MMMLKPFIMDHPLIQHKVTLLRDKNTGSKEFRELINEVAMLMCYEATRDMPVKQIEIETPICIAKANVISGRKVAFIPILRAGLGMVDGLLKLVPAAKVGHIGMYRDHETHLPVEYYCKLPADIEERDVIVLDPMLATGGSAVDAIDQLKKRGCSRSFHHICKGKKYKDRYPCQTRKNKRKVFQTTINFLLSFSHKTYLLNLTLKKIQL